MQYLHIYVQENISTLYLHLYFLHFMGMFGHIKIVTHEP